MKSESVSLPANRGLQHGGPADLRYDDADKDDDMYSRVVQELANRRALFFDLNTSPSFGRGRRRARARCDCRICRRGRSRCGI